MLSGLASGSSELSSLDPFSSELVTKEDVCPPPTLLLCFDECRFLLRADDDDDDERPLFRGPALDEGVSISLYFMTGSSGIFEYLSLNIC